MNQESHTNIGAFSPVMEPASSRFSPKTFEKNLLALLRADPGQAEHLRHLPKPGEDIKIFQTKSGHTGFFARGRYLNSRYEPVKESINEVEKAVKSFGSVPKTFCVLGSAGGFLVRAALDAGSREVFVYEPDAEVLAAALGIVDFTADINRGLLKFAYRVEKVYITVHHKVRMEPDLALVVVPGYLKAYPKAVSDIKERLVILVRDSEMVSQTVLARIKIWFEYALENLLPFATKPGVEALKNLFPHVPVVIVSAGPSLDKNIGVLAEHKNKVVIISVGTSLAKLDRYGIVPHMSVAVESNDIRNQFDGISYTDKIFTALNLNCFPKLWDMPFRGIFGLTGGAADNAWMLERLGRMESKIAVGGSVSNAAFSIAELMGADPIILIGQDLAFTDSGELHAKGIGLLGAEDIKPEIIAKRNDEAELAKDGYYLIDGYHGGKVLSKSNLRNYLIWFEQSVSSVTVQGRRAINCTEGGAKIAGFEQLPLSEVLGGRDPLPFDAFEKIASVDRRPPLDKEAFIKSLRTAAAQARDLYLSASKLIEKIEDALTTTMNHSLRLKKMQSTLRLAEQTDKRAFPLLESLDLLITPLCNKAVLLSETAFDYEGLNTEQQARLNLQQTFMLYSSIFRASFYLKQTLNALADKMEAALPD
jgi:hypothetical protein